MPRFGRPQQPQTGQSAPRDQPGARRSVRATRAALSGRRFEPEQSNAAKAALVRGLAKARLTTPRRLTLAGAGVAFLVLVGAASAAGGGGDTVSKAQPPSAPSAAATATTAPSRAATITATAAPGSAGASGQGTGAVASIVAPSASASAAPPTATATSVPPTSTVAPPTPTPLPATATPLPPTPTPTPKPPVDTCGAPANAWGYSYCQQAGYALIFGPGPPAAFCNTFSCIASFRDGAGYVVQCVDGQMAHSGGRQGACSNHGGTSRALYGPQ